MRSACTALGHFKHKLSQSVVVQNKVIKGGTAKMSLVFLFSLHLSYRALDLQNFVSPIHNTP